MDDAPETRRRIGIVVAQGYRESRQRVQFSCVTPEDAIVTFPAYPDHSFKHLRRLHQKGVQAVVKVVEGESQTEVRVPWSRWVETTPPDLPDTDTHTMPQISKEVMARVESGVEETGAVDVLSDDWGQLGLLDRSAALLLKPLTLPARAAAAARGEEWEDEEGEVEGEGEEEEEEEEQSSPDILKLQMLQRKMIETDTRTSPGPPPLLRHPYNASFVTTTPASRTYTRRRHTPLP
ncbi:hypothetical protein Pmani_031935 [Petrolisthes manimaculis]|uniref:Uncharacterized protein n=1 Tax=Petrolisthes manimaculis TaxID=1843537 RepID=A0AAE1NUD1_9EUCA|nr:hypothetical protein Pmani_031935 [Petrolisthes manimaculis]